MDLPPSGWYPDPYGTPALLRWWDGAVWTRHTHQDGADAAATRVQPNSVHPNSVHPNSVHPNTVHPNTVHPNTAALSRARPPTGPPTSPQPALPDTTVQPAVAPTAYQPAVAPTAYQAAVTRVQPSQPAGFPAGAGGGASGGGASGGGASGGGASGGGADGTQVLFRGGDAWQPPGTAGGGTPQWGYGYQQARRRRRMWLMGGLAAGTAVAVAGIGVLVAGLGSPTASTAAHQTPVTPSASTAVASPTPTPTTSPSASASAPAATLSDGQSGLSYTQLATPWQASCPGTLNNPAFSWTSGESAIAGQVNGGGTTWYGEACSGPLPQQYGYTGVADLENTATSLANAFQGAYYSALAHTATPEVSQPVTISGHAGWEITFAITYTNAQAQGVTWADEQAAVVVVDSGTGNTPAVFFTSIPANLNESNVASLVSSLQLSAVPQASSSPTADSGSPSDGGSPNDNGSPAAGNNP